jgi:hypothetical protein
MAEINNLTRRFSHEKKMAGNKWYYGFIARHPEGSLRQPEATFVARAGGLCKEIVTKFFSVLDKIFHESSLYAGRIFNMDEFTLSTVQEPQKVLAHKGKHQVGAMTNAGIGTNTRCTCCMSAAGMFVPPLLIFKRIRFKFELSTGAPPGTLLCLHKKWLDHERRFCSVAHTFYTNHEARQRNKSITSFGRAYVVQPKSSRNLNAARKPLVVQLWASRYRELYSL